MNMPMDELALSKDKRCEARRIRLVDRGDPYFRQISKSRVAKPNGPQESIGVELDSNNSKKCITLADCDEFLSTGLCFYDEGEAACLSPSWFVILKPMDIERWKCAAVLLKETRSWDTYADYEGLLERYEPDWRPLYEQRKDLGMAVWISFVCVECIYGGLHALAWNSTFTPTHEKKLWHFAVVVIVAFGPAIMLLFKGSKICWTEDLGLDIYQEAKTYPFADWKICRACCYEESLCAFCGYGTLYFLIFCVLDALARILLVMECFKALFNSAPGVFDEPSWSAYVPHIN